MKHLIMNLMRGYRLTGTLHTTEGSFFLGYPTSVYESTRGWTAEFFQACGVKGRTLQLELQAGSASYVTQFLPRDQRYASFGDEVTVFQEFGL